MTVHTYGIVNVDIHSKVKLHKKYYAHYFYSYIYIRGAYDKFPDFVRMGTFIESTHMKL